MCSFPVRPFPRLLQSDASLRFPPRHQLSSRVLLMTLLRPWSGAFSPRAPPFTTQFPAASSAALAMAAWGYESQFQGFRSQIFGEINQLVS